MTSDTEPIDQLVDQFTDRYDDEEIRDMDQWELTRLFAHTVGMRTTSTDDALDALDEIDHTVGRPEDN